MATIATTTNTTPFIYPSTTLLDRSPKNGYLYCMVKSSTANNFDLYRSTNNGLSWSLFVTTTRANVQEIGSIFVDNRNYLTWVYRTNESTQDRIWLRRMNLYNGTWQISEKLVAAPGNGGVPGALHNGMDVMVVILTSEQVRFVVAVGTQVGGQRGVSLYGVSMGYPGTTSNTVVDNSLIGTKRQWLETGTGRVTPSIDIEHNGDGKSSNVPHLWVSWGRSKLYMVKCAWGSANRWTGPTSAQTILSALTPAQDFTSARWDGSRWLMVVPDPVNTDAVRLLERNQANSTTTTRVTPAHPTGVVRYCAVTYDKVSKDPRVYAVGTSTSVLYYVDFIRSSGNWTNWGTVHATAITGGNNFGVRRSTYGSNKFDVYSHHATNTATHTQQSQSYPPNIPTWTQPAVTGSAADVNAPLLLDWEFTDPDPADTQLSYALSRQVGTGAITYWRASDSTWQATEQQNSSATSEVTLPAGWADNLSLSATMTASAENPPNETAAKAGDGVVSTKWLAFATTGWLRAQLTGASVVTRYVLISANDFSDRDPKNWQFQGSNDGTGWTTLDTRTNETFASRLLAKEYSCTNSTAYLYYRLNITANNGSATATQLAEFVVIGGGDQAQTYKVKVWDSASSASSYSDGMAIVPSSPVNPTITTPTASQILASGEVIVAWTVGEQTAFRVVLKEGVNAIFDSGFVTSTDTEYAVPFALEDNTSYSVDLYTKNNDGLASAVQTQNFSTDFIEPAKPTLVCGPVTSRGRILVTISQPVSDIATYVGAGAAATGNNASLNPALPSGLVVGDAMLLLASIRNSGTGTVNLPTNWKSIVNFGNVRLMAKLYQTGDTAPNVTFTGGAAGEDTLAQVAAWRGLGDGASIFATLLNGSAQNISYPALTVPVDNQVIVYLGWKQDDWTSVATIASATEIGEATSTAGNDAGQVWDYLIQTTAANISAASFTVTGGVSAISRGVVVAMSPKPSTTGIDLYRREVGEVSDGIRIAVGLMPGTIFEDWKAVSGVAYEYRALAHGANGTLVYSDWTA